MWQLWLGLEAKHFENMQTAAFGNFISATRVKGLWYVRVKSVHVQFVNASAARVCMCSSGMHVRCVQGTAQDAQFVQSPCFKLNRHINQQRYQVMTIR